MINDNSFINNLNNSNPSNIKLLGNITEDSYASHFLDNTFCVFKSLINEELYLVYSTKIISIICFNIINNKKINQIKNAHEKYISNFRYYFDKMNKRDLIMSISSIDNNLKLWNINNLECLYNFKKVNSIGRLISSCFINDNNLTYILSSNSNHPNDCEPIKIFELNGNQLKSLNQSNDNTFFIGTFYNKRIYKTYIITGNYGYVKSYDYNDDCLYHKYDGNDNRRHYSLDINESENDDIIKLIDSSCSGIIRIWDFNSGELLNKINVDDNMIYSVCLWNWNYLFIGCMDNTIKLIDLVKGEIIKVLTECDNFIICVKKVKHPKYGECLVSQGLGKEQIKIWINNE